MDETAPQIEQQITLGKVVIRLVDDEIEIHTERAAGLTVRVPAARLESWAIRLLREELAA